MPRDPRPAPRETVIPSNSLVASVARYEVGKTERMYRPVQDWQPEAYRHFEICGEARYAATFFGHAMSRAVLGVGKRSSKGVTPVTTGDSVDRLEELFNGSEGREQMLRDIGIHLTIAGECWLVGRTVNNVDQWEVVSILEMNVTGNGKTARWSIDYGNGQDRVDLTSNDVVIRIWTPHPGKRIEADSPFRSLLPVLSEIEWLTRHIFTQLQSRLAGAGIMWVPDGITFPPPPPEPGEEGKARSDSSELDGVMKTLYATMKAAKANPDHPAALVPIVAKVPAEAIDKINLMHFWSPLDEKALEMRSAAVHRFALGMDLAPEQVEGMGSNPGTGGGNSNGVSHWGAWQVEESTIKMHIEPALDMVVNALTIGYLRPLTEKVDEVVTYDTSALRLRPDRSKESMELYQMGGLKLSVMLRENGFTDKDMPDEAEYKTWMLRKIATGSATPEQVQAALSALGVELDTASAAPRGPAVVDGPMREARPAPSLVDHPTRPRTPEERVASLMPACESLTLTALQRAGNRIRQKTQVKVPGVPATEVHTTYRCNGDAATYLADGFPFAEQVLDGVADDPAKVVATLSAYCHTLLAEQTPHSRDRLASFLAKVV